MECTCLTCKSACTNRPGFFLPGEAENAAVLLGVSMKEFFDSRLTVDYYLTDEKPIFLLAPSTVRSEPGTEAPANPRGICTFYKNDLCEIHRAKPSECADYDHTKTDADSMTHRKSVVAAWDTEENQAKIRDLLGREPSVPDADFFDVFSLLFGQM